LGSPGKGILGGGAVQVTAQEKHKEKNKTIKKGRELEREVYL